MGLSVSLLACLAFPPGLTSYVTNTWRMIGTAKRRNLAAHPPFSSPPVANLRLRGNSLLVCSFSLPLAMAWKEPCLADWLSDLDAIAIER